MKENAYKQAGVDIAAGAALVERIKPHVKATRRSGVMSDLGGFGAFFDVRKAGYDDPVLVSSTDGVGTKLRIAIDAGIHDTVGIDLVAMCVNDVIVQGAEPLFFLDYFATGKLDNDVAETVIAGIAKGCEIAGCALIGGETAEMPGVYAPGDYDLAGFTVGAVARDRIVDGGRIRVGDVILGLASSGAHSNGFSLVRRIAQDMAGLRYDDPAPFAHHLPTLGAALLTPTRIYVRPLLRALAIADEDGAPSITGMAHITGGGLTENIPRILSGDVMAQIDAAKWPLPPVFGWLKQAGGLDDDELAVTFNCGIGMVVVCRETQEAAVRETLEAAGEKVFRIGAIVPRRGEDAVVIENRKPAWKG